MSSTAGAARFPEDGDRLLVYVIYDRRGEVGDYVIHALRALRPHAARILAVVNGSLTTEARGRLDAVVDEILVRDNTGFDIEAHRDALSHLGAAVLDYDEVVLANDTWYGPIRPFGPVFERMDATAVDFWGMTEHPAVVPNPFTGAGVLPSHLQSYWIAVRRRMVASDHWRAYWRDLVPITSYNEAILSHEVVFTEHFCDRGFTAGVAYSAADYPSDHAALFHADLLMRDGCPTLKRRALFHYPTLLARHAVIGRDIVADVDRFGYPIRLIYSDLARNVAPRTLNTNLGMLDIVWTTRKALVDDTARFAVVIRAATASAAARATDWISTLPASTPVRVVTSETADAEHVETAWLSAAPSQPLSVVPAAAGLLGGWADLVDDDTLSMVLCVDGALWEEGSTNELHYRTLTVLPSMTDMSSSVPHMLEMLEREEGLGVILPLPLHDSDEAGALRWPGLRPRVAAAVAMLGIRVPVDEFGPLMPQGAWAARPAALRRLAAAPLSAIDDEVQRNLLTLAAGEDGFHTRTIATAEYAALAHGAVEYKLDRLLATTRGASRMEQIQFLQRIQWRGEMSLLTAVRMRMRISHPDGTHPALPVLRLGGALVGAARRARSRLLRRGSV